MPFYAMRITAEIIEQNNSLPLIRASILSLIDICVMCTHFHCSIQARVISLYTRMILPKTQNRFFDLPQIRKYM